MAPLIDFTLPNGDTLTAARRAPPAPTRPPRSAPAWRAPRSRSRSTAITLDLARPLPTDGAGEIEIVTERSGDDALELIRHDAAHVLAEAVLELYPGVKISIGPPIENGFYYDFELPDGVSRSATPTSRRSRRGCASTSTPTSRSSARTSPSRTALERFVREEPGLQGRADRGPRQERPATRRSRPSRSTPTARSPTSAAARTPRAPSGSRPSSCSRSPAPTGAATRTARC